MKIAIVGTGAMGSIYAGLLGLFLVASGPLERWGMEWLSVHMIMHVVEMFFLPPLLIIGAPSVPLMFAFPVDSRRRLLRASIRLFSARGYHGVSVDQIVAVHANAHYTYVFDGGDKLFCPLSIGEVESRLDGGRFVRVHRSHIVNIDRVVGYKRSGDNELVEMAAIEHYLVPVSRSRVASLKSRVAGLTGASADFASGRDRFAGQ